MVHVVIVDLFCLAEYKTEISQWKFENPVKFFCLSFLRFQDFGVLMLFCEIFQTEVVNRERFVDEEWKTLAQQSAEKKTVQPVCVDFVLVSFG